MTKLTDQQRAELERWAQALESGKYRQTACALHDDAGFCCLGVYADICGAKWNATDDMERAPFVGCKQVGGLGGNELLERWWLRERTGVDTTVALTNANDAGVKFAAIASALRKFAATGELPDSIVKDTA